MTVCACLLPGRALIESTDYSVEDRGYETPCWIWLRGTRDGKPIFARNGQRGYAQRVMWEQTFGEEIGNRSLMRQCEARLCINPSHFRFSRRVLGLAPREPTPPEKVREASLLRKYGLTPAAYDELLDAQDGRCAVCHREDSGDRLGRPLHVDHDHQTGRVRGLLCSRCNNSIGQAEEDPQRLRDLADYLERTGTSSL